MNLLLRNYHPKDKEKVISLIESMQKYAASLDPIKRVRCMPGYGKHTYKEMEESFIKNNGKCFVAELDSHIVGYIWGLIAKQTPQNLLSVIPSKYGVIKDFFVDEKYRNRQIGSLLIKKLESYFKESSCDSVFLQVFAPNKNAYEFYKH
ncbi:GNAT family N-acetyltransferase [Candidatus Roizmanbacteria bacterium]|nr:GNAT family N-acetyltransferase [Candidatus Roizmanbacteria bacterium]